MVVSPPRSRSISLAARRGRKEDVTRVVSVTERFSACPQLKDLKAGSLAELCDILLTFERVDMHHRSGLDRQRNHRPSSGPDHSRNFAKGRLNGRDVLKDLRGNEQVRRLVRKRQAGGLTPAGFLPALDVPPLRQEFSVFHCPRADVP